MCNSTPPLSPLLGLSVFNTLIEGKWKSDIFWLKSIKINNNANFLQGVLFEVKISYYSTHGILISNLYKFITNVLPQIISKYIWGKKFITRMIHSLRWLLWRAYNNTHQNQWLSNCVLETKMQIRNGSNCSGWKRFHGERSGKQCYNKAPSQALAMHLAH